MPRLGLVLLLAGLCACKPTAGADLTLTPARGPMSGYFDVRIETDLDVEAVRLGGLNATDLRVEAGAVTVRVQGHPTPGPTDLELVHADGTTVVEDAFRWDPAEPGFETFVAMGASLSQGVQGGVPTQHGQLHSPSRFIAQQTGAYHPVPLHILDLFPAIRGQHISPAPDCKEPNIVDHLTNAAIDVLGKLNDPDNNRIDFTRGLVDPELVPYNVATGNSGVPTMVHGPDPDDFAEGFLARFVFDPTIDIVDPIEGSQLALVEALEPTVIVCADTYGNDLLAWRPVEDVAPDLAIYVDRLAATGADVFLANIPRPTVLPGANSNPERDALADAYRAALDAEAARYDNVHVVDFYGAVEAALDTGVELDLHTLPMEAYGGLLSTDGLHLSDVGYAWEANLFLEAMNAALGLDLPLVDLNAVYPTDEHRPEALLEQGIDPDCLPEAFRP